MKARRAPRAGAHDPVRLADGSRVSIRPVQPGDKPLLADAFAALSAESRYRRFFTPLRGLDAERLAYLTELDHHDHEARLAIDERGGSCAGVARFVRVAPEVAEPAVVVADYWQRHGLGTALLEELADRARAEGRARFSAIVLAERPRRDPAARTAGRRDARGRGRRAALPHRAFGCRESRSDASRGSARGGRRPGRSGARVRAPQIARR